MFYIKRILPIRNVNTMHFSYSQLNHRHQLNYRLFLLQFSLLADTRW
jgi:hypothetical protein